MNLYSLITGTGIIFYSLSAGGMGNVIGCPYYSGIDYQRVVDNNPISVFHQGARAFCEGSNQEALQCMHKASKASHIMASFILGSYYRTDKTLNHLDGLTSNPKNRQQAIAYYETTLRQIERVSNYPYGTYPDIPVLEQHYLISAQVYASLPRFYSIEYKNILHSAMNKTARSEDPFHASHVDTIELLQKMRDVSSACLSRKALQIWGDDKEEILTSLHGRCQAMQDFAEIALNKEKARLEAVEQCREMGYPLKRCLPHHDKAMSIVYEFRRMWDRMFLYPRIIVVEEQF